MLKKKPEPFVYQYERCPVCRLVLHIYFFPYVDRHRRSDRDFTACLLCKGEEQLARLRARLTKLNQVISDSIDEECVSGACPTR